MLVAVVIIVLFGILESVNLNPFHRIRGIFYSEPVLQNISVTVLEDIVTEVFQIATLEIDSRNTSVLEIVPGGFLNPGTITLLLEYDSRVKLGVRNPQQIHMRRVGDVIFVDSSTIQIEVLETQVRNFSRAGLFRSNPLLSLTPAVLDQVFEAQTRYEATAAQRLSTERNIETAKRNFITTFEAVCGGLGLTVIWE